MRPPPARRVPVTVALLLAVCLTAAATSAAAGPVSSAGPGQDQGDPDPGPRSSTPDEWINWLSLGDSLAAGAGWLELYSEASGGELGCQQGWVSYNTEAASEIRRRRADPPRHLIGIPEAYLACAGARLMGNRWEDVPQQIDRADSDYDVITLAVGDEEAGYRDALTEVCPTPIEYLDEEGNHTVVSGCWQLMYEHDIFDRVVASHPDAPEDLDSWTIREPGHQHLLATAFDLLVDELHSPAEAEQLRADLRTTFDRLVGKLADGGVIVVVGYPNVFADPTDWPMGWHGDSCQGVGQELVTLFRSMTADLNDLVTEVAAAYPEVSYLDGGYFEAAYRPDGIPENHTLCSPDDPWIHGLDPIEGLEDAHVAYLPDAPGHVAIGRHLADRIELLRWGSVTGQEASCMAQTQRADRDSDALSAVLDFLMFLEEGDHPAAAELWYGYPDVGYGQDKVEALEQLYPTSPWSSDIVWWPYAYYRPGSHPLHIVSVVNEGSAGEAGTASSFLVGEADGAVQIRRLPVAQAAFGVDPVQGSTVSVGDRITIPYTSMPAHGGYPAGGTRSSDQAWINGTLASASPVDEDTVAATNPGRGFGLGGVQVEVPEDCAGQQLLVTLAFETNDELPAVISVVYQVDGERVPEGDTNSGIFE